MLPNNETNSNVVEIQQLQQQNNSTPSSEDLLKQKIESLGKEIKSLQKQGRLDRGIFRLGAIGFISYLVATNWSAIASAFSTTGTATVAAGTAAVPIAGIVIGAVVGAIVLVGASYAMWKYRAQIKEGFKYAAEKTVDGAKYIGGKIRDGAVYSKNKVKEGYEYSAASLERGVSFVGEKVKKGASCVTEAAANKLYNAAGSENYSDRINDELVPDSSQKKKIQEIKGDLKAIFADKGNNSGLVKNILSGISSKIDLKMAEEAKLGWKEYTPKWQVQKEFIHNLNEKSLYSLLTKRSLPKYRYFIDSVFSDHYDEIKEVIKECKESHLYSSVSNMFNKAEKRANRPSFKSLTRSISSSLSSLGRKDSTQSTSSLSESSSMSSLDSVRTESTISSEAELFNPAKHKEVKTTAPFKVPLWLGGKKAPEETTNVKYQVLSESDTLSRQVGKSTFYVDTPIPIENTGKTATAGGRLSGKQPIPVTPPKVSRSSSTDSRMGSGSSTPKSPSLEDLSKARAELKKTGYLGKMVEQPSTCKSEVYIEPQQPGVTSGK
ncbi:MULTISPECIES: hypothetical protein [unclassified Wolbachia]|uniref:actin-bundling T4SS effector WalE1 family protein n=1 Tax=unclassified Wolbachia TaxID=2640676 RepID=UPI00223165EE|nr:hypothetical protein [Wolbachia endosymbiont (group A) of Macropis europaea]